MPNRHQRETIELICQRLNVAVREIKPRSSGHLLVCFTASNLSRPVTCTLSSTPSDHRSQLNAVSDVRKQVMQFITSGK